MSHRRRLVIFALTLMPLFLFAAPAHAQSLPSSTDPFVVLTGRIDIALGDTVSDAVIFNGPVNVEGTVTNNVVAFNGDVLISGSVGGNVTALNGRVTVTSGAHVGGNVESQATPEIAPGTVSGQVQRFSGFKTGDLGLAFLGRVFMWFIATVSSFLLGLALTLWLPRAADALAETSARRMGASFGFGALWFVGLPIIGGLLAVTIVAGLIGLGLLLGLLLIYTVSYAIGAFLLGRRLLPSPRGRFIAFLAGWAILRMAALVPVLGGIAWTLTVLWGLGALMLTAFRAARRGSAAPDPVASTSFAPSAGRERPPTPPMPT
jgi:hypothetical protein